MDVLMPQLGETVAEGKISTWFKSVGDAVKPGDNLFEIETDKVSMEVPSISAGVLAEIRVPAGDVAPVGAIVAVISDQAGATTSPQAAATGAPPKTPVSPPRAPAPAVAIPAAAQHPATPIVLDPFREVRTPERNFGPAKQPGGAVTTPLARRLAGEAGIDLSRLSGSGPHGRIVARDVQAALAARPAAALSSARGATAEQVKALYRDVPHEELPLDNMRRTIASRMVQAAQSIPHFYLSMDVTLDASAGAARAGECCRRQRRRVSALQALGQRLHHQGDGVGAPARAGRERRVGGGSHLAFHALRRGGRGRDRERPADSGDPRRGDENDQRDLVRDALPRCSRARAQAHAARVSGRIDCDFQPRHVRHPRLLPRSSTRRTRPSWRSARRSAVRSRPPTAACASSAR